MQPELPEYDLEAALTDARKSVELGPNDDPSHWALGLVLFQLGHFDEAAAEFATALRLNPHPYIWESGFHAVALSATGHYKEAIAEIEGASAGQPRVGTGRQSHQPARKRAAAVAERPCGPLLARSVLRVGRP
jgi:Flp pilus assembly protein TadD